MKSCAIDGCTSPALVEIDGRALCQDHGIGLLEMETQAQERIKALGVPPDLLGPVHDAGQMTERISALRKWLVANPERVRRVYGSASKDHGEEND